MPLFTEVQILSFTVLNEATMSIFPTEESNTVATPLNLEPTFRIKPLDWKLENRRGVNIFVSNGCSQTYLINEKPVGSYYYMEVWQDRISEEFYEKSIAELKLKANTPLS